MELSSDRRKCRAGVGGKSKPSALQKFSSFGIFESWEWSLNDCRRVKPKWFRYTYWLLANDSTARESNQYSYCSHASPSMLWTEKSREQRVIGFRLDLIGCKKIVFPVIFVSLLQRYLGPSQSQPDSKPMQSRTTFHSQVKTACSVWSRIMSYVVWSPCERSYLLAHDFPKQTVFAQSSFLVLDDLNDNQRGV